MAITACIPKAFREKLEEDLNKYIIPYSEVGKLVLFEGKEYIVPFWVKWVVRNNDGSICGFESKPLRDKKLKVFYTSHKKRSILLYSPPDWRKSKIEV